MNGNDAIYTLGIDVGGSVVKGVLVEYGEHPRVIRRVMEKIRKRNPMQVADDLMNSLLQERSLGYDDIAYIASTGEGEMVTKKRGHFYGMTTHARGALTFCPDARTVVDMGALYSRAIRIDPTGRVVDYKMTGQCASGSGQFIENISRYLGLSIEEIGDVSLQATNPEQPSGICAVLAETDVINMVSRGIATPDIIKGIHLSVASRIVRLLTSLKAESPIALTGGLALNKGMVQAIVELLQKNGKNAYTVVTSPDAVYAGAIGAALWGGYRHIVLKRKEEAMAER